MSNIHKLNILADTFLSGNIMEKFSPIKITANCSVTLCPKESVAFSLNDITAGGVTTYQRSLKTNDQALARVVVSYTRSLEWLDNPSMFYYDISAYVNQMLCSLVDVVGGLEGREVICARPGSHNEYFRQLDTHAGYELRLFVK